MKITKERLTRIIKEEISNVLGENDKQIDELEYEQRVLATKMDDFNDMLSAEGRGPTDEEQREYAELENEYRKLSQLIRAATPAPPPEPEDDYLDDSPNPGPGFDAVLLPYDQRKMIKIKSLVPPDIQSQGEKAIYDYLDKAKEDSELYKVIRDLLDGPDREGGNWNLEDLPRPKMWNSIPQEISENENTRYVIRAYSPSSRKRGEAMLFQVFAKDDKDAIAKAAASSKTDNSQPIEIAYEYMNK